ncbi:MAG TPA: DVUA0089 family protein, partial [Cytophagales bacterium]|nr:DVUA0089 family protein [Cytophagales bacterium]
NAVSYSHSGELGSSWQTDPSDPLWVSSCTGISKKKGSSFENPIELGGIGTATAFTNTQNNSPANNFGDDIGQVSDDIVYSFYLNTTSLVTIHTCGSTVNDTYLSLYRSNRQLVLKNDDNGFGGTLCSDYYKASIKANLSQGTYYVVAEGYSNNHIGNITTHIKVEAPDASTVYRTEGQSAETGVVDKYREQIHPYPNPIKEGLLHFGRQATTYALINSAGTVLLQGVNRENIAIDRLPPGLYILQLDENRQKIVIE